MNARDLIHTAINSNQAPVLKSGNLSSRRNAIYSYRLCIAALAPDFSSWFIHAARSSVTTNKHVSWTRYAINSQAIPVAEVPDSSWDSLDIVHKNNKNWYWSQYQDALQKAATARQRKAEYIREAQGMRNAALLYAAQYALGEDYAPPAISDDIAATLKGISEAKRASEAAKKVEDLAKAKKELREWQANKRMSVSHRVKSMLGFDYIRLDKAGDAETTAGARVSHLHFKHAYTALIAASAGNAAMIGVKIGELYEIRKADKKAITVGCHCINVANLKAIAKKAGITE